MSDNESTKEKSKRKIKMFLLVALPTIAISVYLVSYAILQNRMIEQVLNP